MSLDAPQLAMVAGEASGDLLASLLLRGVRARWSGAAAFGIGGPRMASLGFDAWWPSDKLAVRGYFEVLRHYREISGIRNALGERLLQQRPDAFIGVDAPDFNLGLAQRLREAGQRTIQFVCPSIWAWRSGRVKKIAARRRSRAVPVSFRAGDPCPRRRCGHLRGPSAGRRNSAAAATQCKPPCAGACGDRRRGRRAAGQPPLGDRGHRAAVSRNGGAVARPSVRGCATCCRWRPGCAPCSSRW